MTIFQFYLQYGRTALHQAAEKGKTNVVETLLHHGADFTVEDRVRIELGISNDKTSFICHLSSHKVASKCNWMTIYTEATG